jgi:hypothetical protein
MQKIKSMFVVLQLDAGGSERVVLELVKSMNPDQFDIVAIFQGGALETPLKKLCFKASF